MNPKRWQWLTLLPAALAAPEREPAEHARLILTLQRSVILPVRMLVVGIVFYHIYSSKWLSAVANSYGVMFETMQNVFATCALFMVAATVLFYVVRRFPPGVVQWIVFTVGLADGVFLAGLTVLTGGFESILYWVYPALILINAISIPLATPQIVLNLLLCVFFLCAGHLEARTQPELTLESLIPKKVRGDNRARVKPEEINSPDAVAGWIRQAPAPVDRLLTNALSRASRFALTTNLEPSLRSTNLPTDLAADLNRIFFPPTRYLPGPEPPEIAADPYALRVAVLLLLTFCCYGLQVLAVRQRRAGEERQEFAFRTGQLRSAGRLAAEVAHQIKNPLAVINNVTFSLQRSLKFQKPELAGQVEIIREEIAKADRIITQIMGYAQLSEGRVEKIEVGEELNRAIAEVFPPGVPSPIKLHRQFDQYFPPLMMHRRHFTEAVGNLLQNARDALERGGNIFMTARCQADYAVEVTVRDDGPGIAPDKLEKVFEAYYTTKSRGTGLGLAVVKHNVELYGGTLRVESELGHGAAFVLLFPAKTLMKLGP